MNWQSFKQLEQTRVPVQTVEASWLSCAGVQLDMLRLDHLHPVISGNKWFKLKNHLRSAFDRDISHIVSFGGAWSNHIHALAAAGHTLGFQTTGVIRGERAENVSDTLKDAERYGMNLHFITRKAYREKHTPEFQASLYKELGLNPENVVIVPEGGSGPEGVQGCEDILRSGNVNPADYSQIWLASGTGATAAGVIRSAPDTFIQSVAVLKGADWMQQEIGHYLKGAAMEGAGMEGAGMEGRPDNWQVETQAHCGGYGRTTPELLEFITRFEQDTGIPLDPVYTGKVIMAFYNRVIAGSVLKGRRVLAIHTGGLQGRRGFKLGC